MTKYVFVFTLFTLFLIRPLQAQVAINNTGADANAHAALDVSSSDKGILIPRLTTNERNAMAGSLSPTEDGMMVYDKDLNSFWAWDGGNAQWKKFSGGVEKIDDLTDGKSDSDGSQDGSSVFLGIDAGSGDDGSDNKNVGVGYQALYTNSTGYDNVAIGHNAGSAITSSYGNIAIGAGSMQSTTTGYFNTAVGDKALMSNVGGDGNVAIGQAALKVSTVDNNTAVGNSCLSLNTSGTLNAALGANALAHNTTAGYNTALGAAALETHSTGNNNTAVGFYTLRANTTGGTNTAIGAYAGTSATGSGNIFIGYYAGVNGSYSNRLYIDNSNANASNALIYGEFDNNILRTNSQFQIGDPAGTGYSFPTARGTANQVLQTDGSGNLSWATAATSEDADFYEEGTTTPPDAITDDIYTQGNVAIGKMTADYPVDVETTGDRGINILQNGSSSNTIYGIYNENVNIGNGSHYGTYNTVTGTGTGPQWGTYNNISNTGSGIHFGTHNVLTGTGTGSQFGVYNIVDNSGNNFNVGIYNELSGSGTGIHRAIENKLIGTGDGEQYGVLTQIDNTGNGDHYGVYSYFSGTGTGSKYGSWVHIQDAAGGDHFGVYCDVPGTGNDYAAVFNRGKIVVNESGGDYDLRVESDHNSNMLFVDASSDRVGIGTNTPGSELEVSGQVTITGGSPGAGKVLTSDAAGLASWQTMPADNDWTINGTNMYSAPTGNVGIGTSTPGSKLEVSGQVTITGGSPGAGKVLTSDAAGLASWQTPAADADFYEEGTTSPPNANTDDIFTMGNVAIGKNTADYPLDIVTGVERGINLQQSFSSTNPQYGIHINNYTTGTGDVHAIYNQLVGSGGGDQEGVHNYISNTGGGGHYGVRNDITGNAIGLQCGVRTTISNTGSGVHYGIDNFISGGNGIHYGVKTYLGGTSGNTGAKYGSWVEISDAAGGNHYGIWCAVPGTGNDYAAVFNTGKVVANESGGDYDFRVESDNNPDMLFVDASANMIGVGTNSPAVELDVAGDIQLTQKLLTPTAGDADMKAYIYGSLRNTDGYAYPNESSGGFTSTKESTGVYRINFIGYNSDKNYLVVANALNVTSPVIITYEKDFGFFRIRAWNLSGGLVDTYLNFVVYKK